MASSVDGYDLLLAMRKATRRSHNIANALILSKLVVVLTNQRLYAHALSSFYPVYRKLEELLQQHKGAKGLSKLVNVTSKIPSRRQAMEKDLHHFLGDSWPSAIRPSAAAQAYANHLQQLADNSPVLLLPYAFSLHVPILLGFMAKRIQKGLQLPNEQGLNFFSVPDKEERLAELRAAVKQAGHDIDPSLRQQVVAEAVEQFRQNNRLVAEFQVGWRALVHAVYATTAQLPVWLLLAVVAVVAAVLYAACVAVHLANTVWG